MGLQGPLTAQALGRSPYDDVVEGTGEDDARAPKQEYDQRGHPINPETKRINKEIIRSHNEIMSIVGVAEIDNPSSVQEAQAQSSIENEAEELLARRIAFAGRWSLDAIGFLGLHGFRQRILVYKRFSEIPFWDLYRDARRDPAYPGYLLSGAPASALTGMIDRFVRSWRVDATWRRWVNEAWAYAKVHLELFVALQRLGLVPMSQMFPMPGYFVPFTSASPMSFPRLPQSLSVTSMLHWFGTLLITNAPFIIFVTTRRINRDTEPIIWKGIIKRLPHPGFFFETDTSSGSTGRIGVSEPGAETPSPSPPPPAEEHAGERPRDEIRSHTPTEPHPTTAQELPDEYATDEEDNEGLSGTLISFDVESSSNVSHGSYSAELRPSQTPGSRTVTRPPIYRSTWLTQLPALLAADILKGTAVRLILAPCEAVALRLVAKSYCMHHDLPSSSIRPLSVLSGVNWTFLVNFMGLELLHLAVAGDIWAVCATISQYMADAGPENDKE